MAKKRITRRAALGSVGAVSLVPALTGAPRATAALTQDGLADRPPQTRPAFVAHLRVARSRAAGGVDAQQGAVSIVDGEIAGPHLQGVVQGGAIQWRTAPGSGSVEITARFGVCCADGRRMEVVDRGLYPAGTVPAAIATAPQLLDLSGDLPRTPAMLAGRLDASQLAHGVARLVAFEV